MWTNAKAAEILGIVAVTPPAAQAAGTVNSGWVAYKDWVEFMAVLSLGALGAAATVQMKLQHATDSGGTGAEDITGKATAVFTQAGTDFSNKQAILSLRPEESVGALLSFRAGNANFVRVSVIVATAASGCAAVLFGAIPRVQPSVDVDAASVVAVA